MNGDRVEFNFDTCLAEYRREAECDGRYPREKSWDYLWDYIQPLATSPYGRNILVTGERLRLTALHIGFYLASWGMFRGSGELYKQNIDFYELLSQYVFLRLDPPFWDVRFDRLRTDDNAVGVVNSTLSSLQRFFRGELPQQDMDLIIGKLLLGVWGQCPAVDAHFKEGYCCSFPEEKPKLSADFLKSLAIKANYNHWNLTIARANGMAYPKGKVVDMAFYQFGQKIEKLKANHG